MFFISQIVLCTVPLKVRFYLIHISNMLEVLNSSANFLIYFACHRYFRPAVTSCQLFVPSRRAATRSERNDTRSPVPATQPDNIFCLHELRDDAEDADNDDNVM